MFDFAKSLAGLLLLRREPLVQRFVRYSGYVRNSTISLCFHVQTLSPERVCSSKCLLCALL